MIRTATRTLSLIQGPVSIHSRVKFCYSQKDERFLRFIDFDAKYLSEIPWFFQPLKPYIHLARDQIFTLNQAVGLPWWVIIMITSLVARATIFPLIFVQMKKISRIGPVWPIFAHIKEGWKDSNLPVGEKIKISWQLYRKLANQQNFKMRSVFVYNLAYYPILICMIFSLRSLLSIQTVAQSGFLYLTSLADIDPYYILPTLTVASYYWNFQRFITPENKHTLVSRMRSLCQVFLILWYPFLCCWPSGIVFYMFCNSVISIIQSSLTTSMWFQSKLNPKIMHYNYMLSTVEYDKSMSESIVEAIKSGEESLKEKAIKESVLLTQTQIMIQKLNKQLQKQEKQTTQEEPQKNEKNDGSLQSVVNDLKATSTDAGKIQNLETIVKQKQSKKKVKK